MLTLFRHDPDTIPGTPAAGHPPIPPELPRLLRRTGEADWPAGSSRPWQVLITLHQEGRDVEAIAVAELLRWCEREGHRGVLWQIKETS